MKLTREKGNGEEKRSIPPPPPKDGKGIKQESTKMALTIKTYGEKRKKVKIRGREKVANCCRRKQ
jgi:hypothetical protein